MPTYYVMHPRSGTVAEVQNAGNTKHARTALLDYLSRKGAINWQDRQNIRQELKVVKGEPGEIQTSVVLDYAGAIPTVQEVPQTVPQPAQQVVQEQEPQQAQAVPPPSRPTMNISVLPSSGSPIAQISRGLAKVRRI
jgi:hypothetical protein